MEGIKDTVYGLMEAMEKQVTRSGKKSPEEALGKIFTKKELKHIKWNYFKKGVMGIAVDSSAWLYHLSLQKDDFLDKIRKDLSDIKDIRFFVGETNAKEKNTIRN